MLKSRKAVVPVILLILAFLGYANVAQALDAGDIISVVSPIGGLVFNALKNGAASVIGGIASGVIGKIVFVLSYIIGFIGGLIVAVEAWVIEIILLLNTKIVESVPVQVGFSITLSLANLGFVLAIIVIAIATILRSAAYGMKKTLFKLIAAAVLVNFSLVIAGGIIGFFDNLTIYFLRSTSPATSSDNVLSGFSNFAGALAGAFNPQKGFLVAEDFDPKVELKLEDNPSFKDIGGTAGDLIGPLLTPIAAFFFVILSLTAMITTLGVFIAMLFYRYVLLGILLIVMPFVWLLWIFPATDKNWKEWWTKFMRWASFGPLVIIFLWIGIQTATELSHQDSKVFFKTEWYKEVPNDPFGFLAFIMQAFVPVIRNFLDIIIVTSVMLGGLFISNRLGIEFANSGINGFRGAVGWMQGRIKNRVLQTGSAALRYKKTPEGTSLAERAVNLANRNKWAARLGVGALGRGAARLATAGGEGLVKDFEKKHSGKSTLELRAAEATAGGAEFIAIKKLLAGKDSVDANMLSEKNKNLFMRFNQSKDYGDIEKKAGVSTDVMEAIKAGKSDAEVADLMDKFIKGLSKADAGKMLANERFVDTDKLTASGQKKLGLDGETLKKLNTIFTDSVARNNIALVPNIISGMKQQNLQNFQKVYSESIDKLPSGDQRDRARDRFNQIISNHALFGSGPPPGSAGTTPAAA